MCILFQRRTSLIIHRSNVYLSFKFILEYIKNLGQHVSTIERPFDLSNTVGISKQCQKDSRQFMETLKKLELWALKSKNSTNSTNKQYYNVIF